jgi:hypothetical protein
MTSEHDQLFNYNRSYHRPDFIVISSCQRTQAKSNPNSGYQKSRIFHQIFSICADRFLARS